jgi:DNA-binding transcriptional ArsR family regulator
VTPHDEAEASWQGVFEALADPTRRFIMDRLADRGPHTATELAAGLPISRPAVIKHLRALERAGLVRSRRQGRHNRFRLDPRPLTTALTWMHALSAKWDERLDALADHVARPPA